MDDDQRLHLQKMISANNVDDNTDLIKLVSPFAESGYSTMYL